MFSAAFPGQEEGIMAAPFPQLPHHKISLGLPVPEPSDELITPRTEYCPHLSAKTHPANPTS